jgi:HK97 family phage portal protein
MLADLIRRPVEHRDQMTTLTSQRPWWYPRASRVGSQTEALSIPPFWRGVKLISESVGQLPLHERLGRTTITPTPRVLSRPYQPFSRADVIAAWVVDLLTHGNACALVVPDEEGFADQLIPVSPADVAIRRRRGVVSYRIGDDDYASDSVFHVRGLMASGDIAGRDVITAHRDGLTAALDVAAYASRTWRSDATPPGLIKTANADLSPEEADDLRARWMQRHGPDTAQRGPAVLPAGVDYEPLAASAKDSQMIESRQFTRVEAADILGLDPSWLAASAGGTGSITYANVQDRRSDLVVFTLAPWIIRIEAELTRFRPPGREVRFNLDGFLRSTTLARYQAHQIALSAEFLTVDEVRDMEDRSPLTPDVEETDE